MSACPKYDWYQTESSVVLEVRLKDQKTEEVNVNLEMNKEFNVNELVLRIRDEVTLTLPLAHPVNSELTFKVFKSKIEIRLSKLIGIRWGALLRSVSSAESSVKEPMMASNVDSNPTVTRYPTSSGRDWDAIGAEVAKELKEEEERMEGEQALNNMFSKIYSDGNDDVKRAMNKSFSESGGTVLSTNWKDIGNKKTDVKPPDGMEFKKWDA